MKHKKTVSVLLAICILISSAALTGYTAGTANAVNIDEDCPDGECIVPEYDDQGEQVYAIVSPVGYHDVEQIEQAPRLDSLDGKTIALVGGSFMASTTHAELIRCLKEEYSNITIYSFDQVGSGGPYSVFGQSSQTTAFQNKLKELGVDAVISGNCGCGLCTTKESGSSIAAEYIGIPAVTVGAPTFVAQIHSTGVNRGVPVLRTAEYPGPFAAHSEAELIKNTREVVFPQIVQALTEPITQAEIALYANEGKRPYDEIIYYGNFGEVQEFCQVNGWTDGLPVVPATDEMVREYLRFTPLNGSDVLGTYALAYRETTVYTVAVNAVMAGVPKEFMPLCIAFTQCLSDSEWRRPLASTHGWSPYAWINGPVARQLGIDNAQGMISEETSKALGRFMDLAMLNLGGYYVKENRMGTFGYLTPFAFSENEEACLRIGWQPYHVTKGYSLNDSTLTAASALQWGNNVTPATDDAEQIMKLLAWDITEKQQNGLGNTNPQVYRTIFITETVARDLAAAYSSKGMLEDSLIEYARRPLWMRTYAHYWANTGSQQFDRRTIEEHYDMLMADSAERAALTDTPEWLAGFTDEEQIYTIATMLKGQTPILVTGDPDRNKFQVLPGGGYCTVRIQLPDNWDELVAPMGYEPLANFFLDETLLPDGGSEGQTAAVIPDGTYRKVASEEYLNDAGRLLITPDGTLRYRISAGADAASAVLSELDPDLSKILRGIGTNCSVTISGGRVTELVLRPSPADRNGWDMSVLDAAVLDGVRLTAAATIKQSKAEGGVTASGSVIGLSGDIQSFALDLGGTAELRNSTAGFASIDGSIVKIDPSSAPGSSAQFIVKLAGGKYRMMTVVKMQDGSLRLTYSVKEN